jgi:hypothetical protein
MIRHNTTSLNNLSTRRREHSKKRNNIHSTRKYKSQGQTNPCTKYIIVFSKSPYPQNRDGPRALPLPLRLHSHSHSHSHSQPRAIYQVARSQQQIRYLYDVIVTRFRCLHGTVLLTAQMGSWKMLTYIAVPSHSHSQPRAIYQVARSQQQIRHQYDVKVA